MSMADFAILVGVDIQLKPKHPPADEETKILYESLQSYLTNRAEDFQKMLLAKVTAELQLGDYQTGTFTVEKERDN